MKKKSSKVRIPVQFLSSVVPNHRWPFVGREYPPEVQQPLRFGGYKSERVKSRTVISINWI